MKDFIFQGTDLRVTYRTDSIDTQRTFSGNFTIHEIRGLEDAKVDRDEEKQMIADFKQLPYNYQDFIQFAKKWGLRLTVQDTTGEDARVLVEEESSESVSGSVSGFFDET